MTERTKGARRWWALFAIASAVLVVGLDTTILSVALPTLSKVLHASESDLQWFSSGYALALAAAMLPVGLLGDRFGHKKALLIALPVFGGGSALCAYSTTIKEVRHHRSSRWLAEWGCLKGNGCPAVLVSGY
jgi:DHA2 family multidrug resistance protein-like MFS transporter